MENQKTNIWNVAALLVLLVVALVAVLLMVQSPVEAAPPAGPLAAPTPVAAPDGVEKGKYFRFQAATAITADTNTSAADALSFETVDIQYVIDQTDINTVTLTVQYSIDGTNYTDGAVLVSANAADAAVVVARVPAFGRYMRVNQNVDGTNPVTITLVAVGR
jgi:hypothetical protein